jgi:hypothetical protein
MTISDWYQKVNAAWPKATPPLTANEAIRAGRKLYRYCLRRTFRGPVRVTSGNRYAWILSGEMIVNPEHGWHGLVHLLSHCFHRRLHPDEKPHSRSHARLELRMINEVISRGWLAGKLAQGDEARAAASKAKRAYQDSTEGKIARLRASEKRWRTRLKRATTALKKITRRLRRLESDAEKPREK